VNTKEIIEDLWCNCGLDNPEPKYHNTACTYRVGWEDYKGSVHMTQAEISIASEVTGWKRDVTTSYDIDFLDRIMMQRTEESYHYGKKSIKGE
jgi:hypothetical protein